MAFERGSRHRKTQPSYLIRYQNERRLSLELVSIKASVTCWGVISALRCKVQLEPRLHGARLAEMQVEVRMHDSCTGPGESSHTPVFQGRHRYFHTIVRYFKKFEVLATIIMM